MTGWQRELRRDARCPRERGSQKSVNYAELVNQFVRNRPPARGQRVEAMEALRFLGLGALPIPVSQRFLAEFALPDRVTHVARPVLFLQGSFPQADQGVPESISGECGAIGPQR